MPETDWGWMIDPEELESWIAREDDDLLLINKPALVVCHPSKKGPWSSLAGAVRERLQGEKSHLIARLDRETSGITLFAKRRPVARSLQMALQHRKTRKTYLAIMEGELKSEITVDAALGKAKDSLVHCKTEVRTNGRRQEAQTRYIPLHTNGKYTLAQVEPITGRKHQIRAHALHIGHSLVGDKLYGPDETLFLDFIDDGWTESMAKILLLKRQALHACKMEFDLEEGTQRFIAPPTPDLVAFCQSHLDLPENKLEELLQAIYR